MANQAQEMDNGLVGNDAGQANLWSCVGVMVSKNVEDDDTKHGEEQWEVNQFLIQKIAFLMWQCFNTLSLSAGLVAEQNQVAF